MPLPINGSLLLQGHSRPGETLHSKPKQAIIVRMSEETLEALEAFPQHPRMDFEFGQNGENAGVYIGDTYFPMRPLAEGSTHDLYLRAASASRPMAPLKLYAHVTGKLAVERELGERIQDRIRESTKDAVKQRSERTTILLDNPPEIPRPKKRGAVPPARRHARPSDPIRSGAQHTSSTVVARVGSPSSSQTKLGGASIPVRKRLIQCLAVGERSPDEVVRLIGGSGCDPSMRRDLLSLLDEVAEPAPGAKKTEKSSSQLWRLKNTAWLDVRPYEWQKLTETQRSNISAAARCAFTTLGLSTNHPAWERVSRPPGNGPADPYTPPARPSRLTSATGASIVVIPKRGLSSREVKDKKAKPKTDSREIMMKDESARAPSRPTNIKGPTDGDDPGLSSATTKVAPRRPPGSGFRTGRASPPEFGPSPVDGPARTRGKPADVREKDQEPPAPSQPARSAPPIPPPVAQEKRLSAPAAPQRTKKTRNGNGLDSDKESSRDREVGGREKEWRERERDRGAIREMGRETTRDREKNRETPRGRDRIGDVQHEHAQERETLREPGDKDSGREAVQNRDREQLPTKRRALDAPTLKRKKPIGKDDDYEDSTCRTKSLKKRRSDEPTNQTLTTSLRESSNAKEAVKRPDTMIAPRPKTLKNELSPLPLPLPKIKTDPSPTPGTHLPIAKVASGSSTSSSTLQANHPSQSHSVSSKSSKPSRAASKGRRRSPIYTSSEDEGDIRRPSRRDGALVPHASTTRTQSLPTDHAALRTRYNTSYLEYLSTFQKLVVQKGKLDTLLKNHSGSVGSITDSDGDVDLMDSDELAQLGSDHRRLREELQTIQQLFRGDSAY